jgi:hypothetical protein
MTSEIEDRFDRTLECIRLHYQGLPNPLKVTFDIYWAFFELFETFDQYVEFFLLQDLVQDGQVQFYLGSGDFTKSALPQDVDQYREYMSNAKAFLTARNSRIQEWSDKK